MAMTVVLTVITVMAEIWLAWRLFGPDREPRYTRPQVRPLKVPGRTVFFDEREFFVREIGPEQSQQLLAAHPPWPNPTQYDIAYGPHPKQLIHFWKAGLDGRQRRKAGFCRRIPLHRGLYRGV